MTFIAGIVLERENDDAVAKVKIWAEEQAHIQQVYDVTGGVDLVAIITAEDMSLYDDMTAHMMAENPQIKRIHTNVV